MADHTQTIITAIYLTGTQIMTEAQFNQMVDDLMFSIEVSIDDSGADRLEKHSERRAAH